MNNSFVIATGNTHKVQEFERILKPLGFHAVRAGDLSIDMDKAQETGSTFSENSFIKAKYAYDICNMPVIADDSGLCVDALDGAPGIYSARFAGENATDDDKCNEILRLLENTDDDKRTASFHCCITCILDDKSIISVEGVCKGRIGPGKQGDEGFGYDPVFIPDDPGNLTMAALGGEIKDQVGHRGQALRMLEKELKSRYGLC